MAALGESKLADDQVELTREVIINGKPETVSARFSKELLLFKSKAVDDLIEDRFAEAIRRFPQATWTGWQSGLPRCP